MKVAAVIPAYNEERTIAGVVGALRRVDLVDEVLVVSDGSTDRTALVARASGARVLELERNLGKGAALAMGLTSTCAEVLLFLDGDLIGLTPEHVQRLLEPVLAGTSAMAVGVFSGGRALTDLAQSIAPCLSGQRAVRRDVMVDALELSGSGFGAEVVLTRSLRRRQVLARKVQLANITHLTKEEKLGLVRGFASRMRMYWEIVRCLP